MLETSRLILRPFRAEDLPAFAAQNRDPEVMRHMPKLLSREESDALAARLIADAERHGFGMLALELKQGAPFIGAVGLVRPSFEAPFMPCVEIGWRLARPYWGHGYVHEAASACLRFGFEVLKLEEIVSFTVPSNTRSYRVMERLGMVRDPSSDFEHPGLAPGHPLRPHILYRLTRRQFSSPGSLAEA